MFLAIIGPMSIDGSSPGPVDPDIMNAETLGDIGYQLEDLGNLSHQLNNTICCIENRKTQQAALTGKSVD